MQQTAQTQDGIVFRPLADAIRPGEQIRKPLAGYETPATFLFVTREPVWLE